MQVSKVNCNDDRDFLLRSQKGELAGSIDSLCLASPSRPSVVLLRRQLQSAGEWAGERLIFESCFRASSAHRLFLALQALSARHSASDTMPLFAVIQLAACQCTKLLVQLARRALFGSAKSSRAEFYQVSRGLSSAMWLC